MKTRQSFLTRFLQLSLCGILVAGSCGCSKQTPDAATSEQTQDAATSQEAVIGNELHAAAAMGNIDKVRAMIANGADVNAKDQDGFPVLFIAAAFLQSDVVKLLIDSGADVNSRDDDGATAFHACYQSALSDMSLYDESAALSITKMLIAAKADVNAKDNDNIPPLIVASAAGYANVAETLIEAGADVNTQDIEGYTPLMLSAMTQHLDVMKVLVKAGANVNVRLSPEKSSASALLAASYRPKEPTCVPLEDIEGAYDCSQLSYFVDDFSDGVKLLLDAGADPNQGDDKGITPLMYAASSGYVEGVKALLQAGASVKATNINNNIALHYVAGCRTSKEEKCCAIAKILLDAGLDVNLQDNDGDTPLIIAAKHEHKMLEQQFLNAGANPKITNKAGESADSIWAAQNAEAK